jgi:hypothetical protein
MIPNTINKYFLKYLTIEKKYEIFGEIYITNLIVYIVMVVIYI